MDVSPVLVADLQAPEAVEPGERPFDHPAVASQAVLGLDTTAGDAGDDAALAQGQTEVTVVVTPLSAWSLCGRRRGLPRVLARMGSMASTVASIIFESCTFAALTRTASGMPWASTTRWRFVPCLPRSVGFLPVSWSPRGRHRGGVQRGPVPVDAIGLGQLFEKHLVQPAPARHPAPTPHLGRQVLPGDARLQHEQDPRQRRPVRHPGPSALGLRRLRRSSGAIRAQNASGNSSFAMAPSSMAPILLPWLLTRRFC